MAPVRFEGFHLLFKNLSEVSFHKLIRTGYFFNKHKNSIQHQVHVLTGRNKKYMAI